MNRTPASPKWWKSLQRSRARRQKGPFEARPFWTAGKIAVVAAVVGALALAVLLLWGPHRRWAENYAPNLFASVAELTLGAGLIGLLANAYRRDRSRPRREAALDLLGEPLQRFAFLLQAMFVEGSAAAPPSLPATMDDLIDSWAPQLPHLDLLREPSVGERQADGGRGTWVQFASREADEIVREIAQIQTRFSDVLGEALSGQLAKLEADRFLQLVRLLPQITPDVEKPGRTMSWYYSLQPWSGGQLVEQFSQTTKRVYSSYNGAVTEPMQIEPDEVYFENILAPFWANSRLDS